MNQLAILSSNYLKHCQYHKRLSARTLTAYRTDLKHFRNFVSDPDSFTDRDLLNDYIHLLNKTYSPKTVRRKIATLKAFFRYLEFEDLIPCQPFSRINVQIRQPSPLPRTIPCSVMEKYFSYLYQEKNKKNTTGKRSLLLRDIAISELLLATGMRISELCSLKKEDLDMNNKTVDIWGKGKKERLLFIDNPSVIHALEDYITCFRSVINQTGYVFVSRLNKPLSDQAVRLMLNKHADNAALHFHLTPHMFRHTFATMLLESDVDIRYIQKILGHSSITTTEIYTNVSIAKQKEILTVKNPRDKLTILV